MADNTNPLAVRFTNEKARVFAESLLTTIQTARSFKSFYDANSMDTVFPATADNIADGSDTDGRPRVSNNAIRALYTAASDLLTWASTGSPTRETRLRTLTDKGEPRY